MKQTKRKRITLKYKIKVKEKIRLLKSYIKIEPPNENDDPDVRGGYVLVEAEFEKESKCG